MKKWSLLLIAIIIIVFLIYQIFSRQSSGEVVSIAPLVIVSLIILSLVYFFVIKGKKFHFPDVPVSRFHWRWVKPLFVLVLTLFVLVLTYVIFTLDYDKIITEMFRDDDSATAQVYEARPIEITEGINYFKKGHSYRYYRDSRKLFVNLVEDGTSELRFQNEEVPIEYWDVEYICKNNETKTYLHGAPSKNGGYHLIIPTETITVKISYEY